MDELQSVEKSQCARFRVAGDGAVAGKQKSLISREARQSASVKKNEKRNVVYLQMQGYF